MFRATFILAKPALLLAFFALAAPAQAGPGATLEVSVRVVDRCTIQVPPAVPPGLAWVGGGQHPIAHACASGTPAAVHAAPHTPVAGGNGPPGLAGGGPPGLTRGKAAGPHVLVTVSY